jgi:hypothetical protein
MSTQGLRAIYLQVEYAKCQTIKKKWHGSRDSSKKNPKISPTINMKQAQVHNHKRKKLLSALNPDPPEEPSSEDGS